MSAAQLAPCSLACLPGFAHPPRRQSSLQPHSSWHRPSTISFTFPSYLHTCTKLSRRRHKEERFFCSVVANKSEAAGNLDGGRSKGVGNYPWSDFSVREKERKINKPRVSSMEGDDGVQSLQVIDRAAAAVAAARAIICKAPVRRGTIDDGGSPAILQSHTTAYEAPGPNFWSWSPPEPEDNIAETGDILHSERSTSSKPNRCTSLMEKGQVVDYLSIPFESMLCEDKHGPPLPPFQSLLEVKRIDPEISIPDMSTMVDRDELYVPYATNAVEAAEALAQNSEASSHGTNPDGSKWWRETGVERRPNGSVCKWTLSRGVSLDRGVEWENKYWEAADKFDYKELGSEKSGRDANGNIWHEHWRESIWQDEKSGLTHIEKIADKWAKKGEADEWQEKWLEHYDAAGKVEKWAHKSCCVDFSTKLQPCHAHIWHERWGEKYDGKRGSMKYTDKWAERCEGDGWSKWGDKWDENFDSQGHGVKQGETWWEGRHEEQWNRTWGEQHNGSGWVHKYGKSSSGEHWDTYVQQDTWYEPYPHYDFVHCFKNSVQLRAVQRAF